MSDSPQKPKLVFVVTEDWYFYSHRRPMIRAAQDAGFAVSVITNVNKHREAIEALGVKVIDFSFERRSLNPFKALKQVWQLVRLYRQEKPQIVHHIAMKPILCGSIAAWRARVPCIINAFAGLGYVFNARSALAYMIRLALLPPFFFLLRRQNSYVLLQNRDDLATLKKCGLIVDERAKIIKGSGVDLEEYPVTALPPAAPDFICAFAGRMINIKGLPTLQEAFALLEKKAPHIKLQLYGSPDPANPGSWRKEQLHQWAARSDNVAYMGRSDDMKSVWAQAHVAIQPSYGGEGLPKSLLEAAACGRAIVATDVPGCREIVSEAVNGFLVPPYNAPALVAAIERLAEDMALCARMGEAGRKLVEADMSAASIQKQTADFYRSCAKKRDKKV